jgi:hypothetical protein
MSTNPSSKFLPALFQSTTNKKFLDATLDQLTEDAKNIPMDGYVGRTFAPTYKQKDNYVTEPTALRQNYQLEPSVVVKNANGEIEFTSGYIDLLNTIANNDGYSYNHQRLFEAQSYSYDGHFDYDKFVNYFNYYWLPNGPLDATGNPTSVPIYANQTPFQATYTVTRNTNINGYEFSGVGNHANLPLTLARGGTYTFVIDQPGYKFWIQTQTRTSGQDVNVATKSTRQIFGVRNNGIDIGTITFQVPLATAQDFYYTMPIASSVTAAVSFSYTDIQNQLLSTFLSRFPQGLDGITSQLNGKTIIFINNASDNSFWTTPALPAGTTNTITINPGTVIANGTRTNVWQLALVPTANGDYLIQISPTTSITSLNRVFVNSGNTLASSQFWLNNNYQYQKVPDITASLDTLYYQDQNNPDFVGTIKIVDNKSSTINVDTEILGQVGYTSPNGVKFTNGLKITFDSSVTPVAYANNSYYVEGVGTAIALADVSKLMVPESYGAAIGTTPDYITINRGSQDLNPWTRYNRWFHKDVILATANYNNSAANYGPNLVARRPIIEFEPNLQLFNFGDQVLSGVNLMSFDATDAFVHVEGQITTTIDGATVTNGQTILFTNDYDTNVTNRVYQVQIQNILSKNYIVLVDTGVTLVAGMSVTPTNGAHAGITYWFNGTTWSTSQVKSTVNQPPLFDLVDENGYSFSNQTTYVGSNFGGSRLFGYSVNASGTTDTILGFGLNYQNFNNIGDIVFTNYYDADTFVWSSGTVNCNTGYIVKNTNGVAVKLNNWTTNIDPTEQFQQFTRFYDGHVITVNGVQQAFVQIDVIPKAQKTVPYCKVYINNKLLTLNTDYQIIGYGIYFLVALTALPNINDKIDVLVFNNAASSMAFYQIPENLNLNPLNQNFNTITLGQLRTHYNKLIENTSANSIPVQDNNLKQQGGTIVQHQAPAIYAITFLNNATTSFIDGITLAKKEYAKFKNKFLSLCSTLTNLNYNDPISGVDTILQNINSVKNNSFPWYYSDMVPQGKNFSSIIYNVVNTRQKNYEITSIFDATQLSNRSVLVWVNGVQRTLGLDYTFSTLVPAIEFLMPLSFGDTILIRDYSDTDGNYIPETPTKLGLYPKFVPSMYLDTTYQTPTMVIQGHDGSITPAFGDFRDQYLLELELRIHNNIKADYGKNQIELASVLPGRFRKTDYSLAEFNKILNKSFLDWVGINNLDYTSNTYYNANNSWTWNYAQFPDTVDNSFLQGSWRAIYNYWFDTDTPNLTPWRMLGFGSMPAWWTTRYGSAPYTKGNALLWQDLELGLIWNNGNSYYDSNFARPGLSGSLTASRGFVPVDKLGNLISPADIPLFSKSNASSAASQFQSGHQGPVETAWRRSSDYAYGIQLALAVAKPAMYFSTQLDTSRFYTNNVTGQFSDVFNRKITPGILKVNGDNISGTTARTSGYVNWIGDNIKNLGMDPVNILNEYFTNLSVQLSYKVAGFTDQKLLTVYAEQTTPGSKNNSVIIPEDNWKVYLNKSTPTKNVEYSAVVVKRTATGYVVSGYSPSNPFFNTIPGLVQGADNETVTVNKLTVVLYNDSSKHIRTIPYGTEFVNVQQLTDFLMAYQRYLTLVCGFVFDAFNTDLGEVQDWRLSTKEMLYWAQQGWQANTVIVLNPVFDTLKLISLEATVDEITNIANGNKLLDQNFLPIKSNNFDLQRITISNYNGFEIKTLNNTSIAYAKLNLVQFEHVLVFDNVDDFGDIIYIPEQGTRQYRLKLTGSKTGAWSGALSAPGYVYSDPHIAAWVPATDYRSGDIVQYNNFYYTATQDIPAAQLFNNILWTRIDQANIQTGLLPNFAHNAQKFINIYDVDQPPLEQDLQLYSAGLIGFRERPYLTDLGLSIPTQTKFYQGFIKQKGTLNAITALTKTTFDNVQGNIKVYEEWALQAGRYGGINSNIFKEFVLDQSVFTSSPAAFVLTNNYNTGNIIANLTLANIYNSSNLSSTSTTIYNNRTTATVATDLPDVGYMNLQDVDHTIFDIGSFTGSIARVAIGDKIWLAKDYANQWQILRVGSTSLKVTKITYVLDNNVQLSLSWAHSFKTGDLFILKEFGQGLDNIYQVILAPNSTTLVVSVSNLDVLRPLIRVLSYTGSGIIYSLNSARYSSTPNLVSATPPVNGWQNNDTVWIDSASANGWGVYTFNNPWLGNTATKSTAFGGNVSNNNYGSSVKINASTGYVYVGNPGQKQVQVLSNVNGSYQFKQLITNTSPGFGGSVEASGNILVVGASTSSNVQIYYTSNNTVGYLQTLTGTNNFGNVLAISGDQHYLYIATPALGSANVYYSAIPGSPTAPYTWVTTVSGSGSYGQAMKTNYDGSLLFVSAPTATSTNSQDGIVYIITRSSNTFTVTQSITSLYDNQGAQFGTGMAIDANGGNLFVGAPGSTASGVENGVVERWVNNSGTFVRNQVIAHPFADSGESFGSSISVSSDAKVLAIGSVGSPAEENTTFDNLLLTIDSDTTKFIDYITNSGTVYMFEALTNQLTANDLGQYLFAQELSTQLKSGDKFGYAVDVTRSIAVAGAPGSLSNSGIAYVFTNPLQSTAWTLTRQQSPQVDINSISRTFLYNQKDNTLLSALDYIDPRKGKLLSVFDNDVDYKLETDPARYNNGTGTIYPDLYWGPTQVGKIWWDLSVVRFINYEQDSLIYRLNHWAMPFPGSEFAVYQWVESDVLPSKYVANGGAGVPHAADDSAYSTYGYVTSSGAVHVKYYFWVQNLDSIGSGKTNSVLSIAAAIENPQSQGIPYATVLRNDAIALYNITGMLVGKNTVLQLGSQSTNPISIHNEYALVQEGNPASTLPSNILNKLTDSLAGIDAKGNPVPNPALTPSQRYGIKNRPIQTMFMNRALALSNYITLVNTYLATYPVIERKSTTLLNSSQPIPLPNSGQYNQVIATEDQLYYIDTTSLYNGYGVLVLNNSMYQGRWTIHYLTSAGAAFSSTPTVIQSYKTNIYWNYADWYDTGFNPTTTPNLTVANLLELGKQTLTANSYVKVLNAGNNNFAIYYIDATLNKTLVGIQNGTIQISTGTIPALELRQILLAMQTQIFIDDLATEFNTIFFTMIKYILTEQKNLDWVFKTSFITATQAIRKLEEFPSYVPDNQSFYLTYIDEVKPYRTIVREFVADYIGLDQYNGDSTDFDLPPYWDATLAVYRSPTGDQPYDTTIWQSGAYTQWYNNYGYGVVDVTIGNPGTGFVFAPQVIISGGGGTGATATATLNGSGGVASIIILTPGQNYTSTPTVTLNGTGNGVVAYPVLRNVFTGNNTGHTVVRSVSTSMKFDRISYTNSNTFVFWNTITSANVGNVLAANTIVVNNNVLYQLNTNFTIGSGLVFPTNYNVLTSNTFSNANDRIVAYNGNVDLSITQPGLSYPGVILDGNTYRGSQWDSTISSKYTDNIGISPGDIIVDGGKYYDTYNSHAPEELAPGRVFDSTGIEVFDIAGPAYRIFDDMNQNHGFYRIGASQTRLSQDLLIADQFIQVSDATKLPQPDPVLAIPGVIFINGEKITYYRNFAYETPIAWSANLIVAPSSVISYNGTLFLTTGNVYANTFASIASNTVVITNNTLGQIRRAVDGTTPFSVNLVNWKQMTNYAVGSYVYYGGNTYVTTGNTYGADRSWSPNIANVAVSSYLTYSGNIYSVTGNVAGSTFNNIRANLSYVRAGTDSGFASIASNLSLAFAGNNAVRQLAGSYVVDASQQQVIPNTATSNVKLQYSTTFTSTQYVTYLLNLVSPITANIGDNFSQVQTITTAWAPNVSYSVGTLLTDNSTGPTYTWLTTGNVYAPYFANITANVVYQFAGNTANTVVMRALQSVTNANTVPVIILSGSIANLPEIFDGSLGFDANGADGNLCIVSSTTPTTRPNVVIPTWTANTVFTVESTIQYNSNVYTIVGNVYAPYFANISSQSNNSANVTLSANAKVALNGPLSNYTTVAASLQPYDQWLNTTTNTLYYWTGSAWTLLVPTTPGVGFDNTSSPLYVNGNITQNYIVNTAILGSVNNNGQVTVPAGTYVTNANIWYATGTTTASNGIPLFQQSTTQANFLKASIGGYVA